MKEVRFLLTVLGLLTTAGCTTVCTTPEQITPLRQPAIFIRSPEHKAGSALHPDELRAFHAALVMHLADASGIRIARDATSATHQLGVLVDELDDGDGVLRFLIGFGVGRVHIALRAVLWDRKAQEVARTTIARMRPWSLRLPAGTRIELLVEGAREVSGFVQRLVDRESQSGQRAHPRSSGKAGTSRNRPAAEEG